MGANITSRWTVEETSNRQAHIADSATEESTWEGEGGVHQTSATLLAVVWEWNWDACGRYRTQSDLRLLRCFSRLGLLLPILHRCFFAPDLVPLASVMTNRSIALQLRTLAASAESQPMLLADAGCLTGLVTLLQPQNEEEVLILALQAATLLATGGSNGPLANARQTLAAQPNLLIALATLTEKNSVVLKTMSQNVLDMLQGAVNGESNGQSSSRGSSTRQTPIASRSGSRDNTRPTTPSGGRDSSQSLAGFQPRYLNHIAFQVTPAAGGALDKDAALAAEKALVAIKGVVSVAYTASGSAANGVKGVPTFTLYTSIRPSNLAPLVSRAVSELRGGWNLTATMVQKAGQTESDKENQQENTQSQPAYLQKSTAGPAYLKAKPAAPAAPAASASASASSGPAYLSATSASSGNTGSRALTTHASATNGSDASAGLAARYQASLMAKKPGGPTTATAVQTPAKKGGLLSSVTSYFW
jgi:hypothetical protein